MFCFKQGQIYTSNVVLSYIRIHTVSAKIATAVASNIIDKGRSIPMMDSKENLLSICREYMYSPKY